ncbi:MAG: F0F1 ATP synthase subunit B [Nitrospinota bacterium]
MGARRWLFPLLLAGALCLAGLAGAAEEEEGGEVARAPVDWFEESAKVLNFLLVAGLLYMLLAKPIRQHMAERRERIERSIAEAEQARREAAALLAEQRARVGELEWALEAQRAEAAREREALRERLVRESERAAQRLIEQTRTAIELEGKKARAQLQAQAATLAIQLAEEMLSKNLGPDDQRRLVEEYLVRLGEKT